MDATTQFDDINHSAKAQTLMRGLYIGDFLSNDKEPWEDYVRRKEREQEGQLAMWQKLVLVAMFVIVFGSLYTYLTSTPLASDLT